MLPRLDIVNVLYRPSLQHFIGSVVPVRRVVAKILDNPVIQRFLAFTPGAREMVTLSRLIQYAKDYDLVVVDMPASGHAFSLLDVTRSALGLFRSGPMRQRATAIRDMLVAGQHADRDGRAPRGDGRQRDARDPRQVRELRHAVAARGGAAQSRHAADPRQLRTGRSFAGWPRPSWTRCKPSSSARASGRTPSRSRPPPRSSACGSISTPVLIPPATDGGQPAEVLESVMVALGRHVGVSRSKLPALHRIDSGPTDVASDAVVSGAALDGWLDARSLVVTVGSGGVGKTTSAAAIGLYAAHRGRRVMVLTIDPARRLANSLGLVAIGNSETRIDLPAEDVADGGELWAMMLDSRSTMDALVDRIAEPEVAERILGNHVYRHMADTFAGSQDYMATEKLYDLVSSERYDLVVLDTPPVKNALDFLESPGRLLNFLDEKILTWFLERPARSGWGIWGLSASAVVHRLLGRVFGDEFLDDLAVFFQDFQGLYEGFRERHGAVVSTLHSDATGFLAICAPTRSSLDVAGYFVDELSARELPLAGVVVNQVHHCQFDEHDASASLGTLASDLAVGLSEPTAAAVLARLGMAHRRLHSTVVSEQIMIGGLRHSARGGGFFQQVPKIRGQVHDLAALAVVGNALFSEAEQL